MNITPGVLLRVVKLLIALELAYLVLVNAALQLDVTQDLVNRIRPEKFHVAWESAWSWYPFHVNARGIRAHGQSRTQQWEVRADAASGSIALLPLLAKRVNISSVDALNVAYRQRPRLKPDRDYAGVQGYFPDIGGRALSPVDTAPRKQKRPWRIALKQGMARGQLDYWIYNVRGSARGSALVDLSYRTQGGAFSLDVRDIDLELAPASVNDARLAQGGTVTGRLAFAPFVPRKNKGVRMLPFLEADAQLDVDVPSLAFINLFTGNLGDLEIKGAGHLIGRLRYERGLVLAGTDLKARAQDLLVHARSMQTLGEGAVHVSTPLQADEPLTLAISYDTFTVTRDGDDAPFLSGDGLDLTYSGSNYVVPDEGLDLDTLVNSEGYRERRKHSTVLLGVEDATLLDMALLNDYLPADTSFQFTGGTANLNADIFAGVSDIEGGLQLKGSKLGMRASGEDLEGDLAADLVIVGGAPRDMRIKLDGSTITLDQVSVVGQKQSFDDQLWSANLVFHRAEAVFDLPVWLSADAGLTVSDTRPLVALFENRRRSPAWLSKLLTLKDIGGDATLLLADGRLKVSDAQVLSDKAEVAVKAVFYETGSDGVVYVRYRKLEAVLKMEGPESNLDVLGARQTFEQYRLR